MHVLRKDSDGGPMNAFGWLLDASQSVELLRQCP